MINVPTDNFHGYPLIVATVFTTIAGILVATKVGVLFASPQLFYDSAIQSAAQQVSLVCQGKLDRVALPPPPPGSYYYATDCGTQLSVQVVQGVFNAYQVIQAATALEEIFGAAKGFKEAGPFSKVASKGADARKLAESSAEGEAVLVKSKNKEALADLLEEIADATSELADATKKLPETSAFKGVPKIAEDSEKIATDAEGISSRTSKLSERVKNAEGDVVIDCKEEPELCQTLLTMDTQLKRLSDERDALALYIANIDGKIVDSIEEFEEGLKDLKKEYKDLKKLVKSKAARQDRELGESLRRYQAEVISAKNSLSRAGRYVDDTTRLSRLGDPNILRLVERGLRKPIQDARVLLSKRLSKWVAMGVVPLISRTDYPQIEYFLAQNPDFVNILSEESTGVFYSPHMVALYRGTSEELQTIYETSLDLAGAFSDFGGYYRSGLVTNFSSKGYYSTASFLDSLDDSEFIEMGIERPSNLDPRIYASAIFEFTEKASDSCDTLYCFTYLMDLQNHTLLFLNGNITKEELEKEVRGYPLDDISEELSDIRELLETLDRAGRDAATLIDASLELQGQLSDYMRDSCNTAPVTVGGRTVVIGDCGLVFDCSFGDFCMYGVPVVQADPWLPYVPIGVLEGEELNLMNLLGLNYDPSGNVVRSSSLIACGGSKWYSVGEFVNAIPNWQKIYLCLTDSEFNRCRVIRCGHDLEFGYGTSLATYALSLRDDAGNIQAVRIEGPILYR